MLGKGKDLIHITIRRIIPAPKFKVVRLVTKVQEFPSYIPSIREVSVVEKSRNKMKTKWRIQVDKVPITWTEEDTLFLKRNRINFQAIDGDLDVFRGEWIFKDHPQGTEVTINSWVRVAIPAIEDFAEDYIGRMLTRNFETILRALESRLISLKYTDYRHEDIESIAGFGVIGHFYNFYHLEKCLKMLNPKFKMPSREFLAQLFHVTPSFKLYDSPPFKSKTGQTVNGCFILATFIPDMIEKDMWTVFSKVVKACRIAEKHGVGIVTLGGFTSIVAERIGQAITDEVDIPVTTGNTFTAGMVIEGVVKACRLLGMDISAAKLAIIGGTGDIGSACARVLVERVAKLTVTGRTRANLSRLKAELAKKHKAKIVATTENEAAVKEADIIIAAASASASILNVNWFKPGAIICDVGYPKNVSYTPTTREDILIFSGGLTRAPMPISFPVDTGLPDTNTIYGCFAEAIILALEKRYESYSFGRGNITVERIAEIVSLGKKHGFEVSDFWWGDKLVGELMVDKIRRSG